MFQGKLDSHVSFYMIWLVRPAILNFISLNFSVFQLIFCFYLNFIGFHLIYKPLIKHVTFKNKQKLFYLQNSVSFISTFFCSRIEVHLISSLKPTFILCDARFSKETHFVAPVRPYTQYAIFKRNSLSCPCPNYCLYVKTF